MNLITIIGARPQFIKCAPVSLEIKSTKNTLNPIFEKVIHTGQHFDKEMSKNFFDELDIQEPDYNLGIAGGRHGSSTGRMIEGIEKILIEENPNLVIVYGDTNSTLAGSIAASKLNIPIVHIESGLRSFNRSQPEEKNRIITDHLSEICFAPTKTAIENLLREGISKKRIVKTGDVMADSVKKFGIETQKEKDFLKKLNIKNQVFILSTIHRAENTDDIYALKSIFEALNYISKLNKDNSQPIPVVIPLHPRTKSALIKNNLSHLLDPLIVLDPIGFKLSMFLQKNASLIVTDSGGIQKEAYINKTPCLTVREETEWKELLKTGWNKLTLPKDKNKIIKDINIQLKFNKKNPTPNFYGDGDSSKTIVNFLQKTFC